jgi:hypothetical protein
VAFLGGVSSVVSDLHDRIASDQSAGDERAAAVFCRASAIRSAFSDRSPGGRRGSSSSTEIACQIARAPSVSVSAA